MSAINTFEELELDLNYRFKDRALLQKALTHSSHAHENTGDDNEQLEFLGDAVLGFVVSDLLYRAYPAFTEGQLSRLKGFFVSSANLVKYAEQLKLGRYLQLGRGEEKTGGRTKQALLVDALEAIIGAVYLDGGLEEARSLVVRFAGTQIQDIGDLNGSSGTFNDYKTALQELLQSRQMPPCRYDLVDESGPEHQKLFTIEIALANGRVVRGVGLTKRAAEQAAARQALEEIRQGDLGDA